MTEFSIMFVTTLQQFWCIVVHNIIDDFEEKWLQSFKKFEKKTGVSFSFDDFLAAMQLKRMECYQAGSLDRIPYDAWAWALMIPYYDLLKSKCDIGPVFKTLGQCVQQESMKTQRAIEQIGKTRVLVLPIGDNSKAMRRYWQLLCEGTNQYIFTIVFAMYIEGLIQSQQAALRWSMKEEWFLQKCYIVDGVFVNSERCVAGCSNVSRKQCNTLQCWRRPHVWILLVVCHAVTKQTRLVNFDITSALLGDANNDLKPRNIGCIPVNCGFRPFVWSGADQQRDFSLFVEKKGAEADRDNLIWNSFSTALDHINDSQANLMRENGKAFYAVACRERVFSIRQIVLQLGSARSVILNDLTSQKIPSEPRNRVESCASFLQSVSRLEMATTRQAIPAFLLQTLTTSIGIAQLYQYVIKLSLS